MPANRPAWGLLSHRKAHEATAGDVYGRLVTLARERAFYAELAVPDTPEGRLELVMLHVVLMLRRLGRDGAAAVPVARALSETFVRDMDDCLREMGVGDMAVAKKVKKAAAALLDRSRDYSMALAEGDRDGLARLVARHVLEAVDGAELPSCAGEIARYVLAMEAALAAAPLDAVLTGSARLPGITAMIAADPGAEP